MQIYPEAEPVTHIAKVPFGVKQYTHDKHLTGNYNHQINSEMIPNLSEIAGNEHQILTEFIHKAQEVCVRIFDCHLSNEIFICILPAMLHEAIISTTVALC